MRFQKNTWVGSKIYWKNKVIDNKECAKESE